MSFHCAIGYFKAEIQSKIKDVLMKKISKSKNLRHRLCSFILNKASILMTWALLSGEVELLNSIAPNTSENNDCGLSVAIMKRLSKEYPEIRYMLYFFAEATKDVVVPLTIYFNKVEILDSLVSNYLSNLNFQFTARNVTPLHVACMSHKDEIISLLMQKGANFSIRDSTGWTPISYLHPKNKNYDTCVDVMVKGMIKSRTRNYFVSTRVIARLTILNVHPKIREHFEKCKSELLQMANDKFHGNHSYYSILNMTKNLNKLAHLVRNKQFVINFVNGLHRYPVYKKNNLKILKDAIQLRDRSKIVDSRLIATLGDLFPHVVLDELAKNLTVEDLPLAPRKSMNIRYGVLHVFTKLFLIYIVDNLPY